MTTDYLDFERPIADLEQKIEALRRIANEQNINLNDEITKLGGKSQALIEEIFSSLSAQQVVQLARHPLRPYTLDYIERIFTDFDELHGDRHYSSAPEIVGGIGRLEGDPVMIIGHQKGRTTKEKLARNFGMPSPESFRKAKRLMELAERFHIPVLTFIDTTGAYPGVAAEEHNQSEAIARNLAVMSVLKTPIVCTVIGEGCSGGALAIGVGDVTLMLQYSYYSVISPEGCASILWKSASKAAEAAQALNLTADRLKSLGLINEVIEEPVGGAHRDPDAMAARIKKRLIHHLSELKKKPINILLEERYQTLLEIGA
ncbi:MAG: acetyl-CoA carboxylase carboxyltransferase subunit alpha [Proteobacteria bacterium]|nr:acetyl-CoA carboxylase carboxyltransferase subunit alpha [Pseudomonadota bacterium]